MDEDSVAKRQGKGIMDEDSGAKRVAKGIKDNDSGAKRQTSRIMAKVEVTSRFYF